jgi:hypothetical protein
MKTAIRRDEMEVLGNRLQTEVQMQFPLKIPLQVKCAMKQQTLIILAQHAYEVSPNPWRTFEVFEQIVRQSYSDLMRSAIATPETLAVRFFLRIAGEHEPYAADGFTLEPDLTKQVLDGRHQAEIAGSSKHQQAVVLSLPAVPATSAQLTGAEAVVGKADNTQAANADLPDQSIVTEEELAVDAVDATQENVPLNEATEAANSEADLSQVEPLEANSVEDEEANHPETSSRLALDSPEATELAVLSEDESSLEPDSELSPAVSASRASHSRLTFLSRLPVPMVGLGAAAGLFALAGSLYMLTRPCVIGACVPLQNSPTA